MAGIFLSYRHEDTQQTVSRMRPVLVRRFARMGKKVFCDLHIPVGADFREEINRALDQCAVLVAVLGRDDATGPQAWRVETARDGNLVVAWTKGELERP